MLLLLAPATFAQVWKPTNYEVAARIKNAGVNVTSRFTGLKANLVFNPNDLAKSSLEASVEVATVKTGIEKRDKDILEEQYFDAAKYKLIDMRSTKIYKKGDKYAGMFNITMKGVTKAVEVPFDFIRNGNDGEFKGSFGLNRRDFGIGGKSMMMSDELTVDIDLKCTQADKQLTHGR